MCLGQVKDFGMQGNRERSEKPLRRIDQFGRGSKKGRGGGGGWGVYPEVSSLGAGIKSDTKWLKWLAKYIVFILTLPLTTCGSVGKFIQLSLCVKWEQWCCNDEMSGHIYNTDLSTWHTRGPQLVFVECNGVSCLFIFQHKTILFKDTKIRVAMLRNSKNHEYVINPWEIWWAILGFLTCVVEHPGMW